MIIGVSNADEKGGYPEEGVELCSSQVDKLSDS